MRFEEDKALREYLEREQVGVPEEDLLVPKQEPQPIPQTESQLGGKHAVQQDYKESL